MPATLTKAMLADLHSGNASISLLPYDQTATDGLAADIPVIVQEVRFLKIKLTLLLLIIALTAFAQADNLKNTSCH